MANIGKELKTEHDILEENPDAQKEIKSKCYFGQSVNIEHIKEAHSSIIFPDETLLGVFHGQALGREQYGIGAQYKGGLRLHDYLLVTDKKVIFWARGLIKSSTDAFLFDDISSVEEAKGFLLGELVINIRGTKERMRSMVKSDVPIACKMIREQILKNKNKSSEKGMESITEQIKKLAELRDLGLLTENEFNSKKSELLSRL